jgi:hypothetical protein
MTTDVTTIRHLTFGRPRAPRDTVPRARLDAGGTRLRLRALHVMGHGSARIARALGVREETIQRLVRGDARTISPAPARRHRGPVRRVVGQARPRPHPRRARRRLSRPPPRQRRELVRRRRPGRRPARRRRLPPPHRLPARHRHGRRC